MKDSFILYQEYQKHLSLLNREQKGALLEAIFEHNEGREIELEPIVAMAFSFIKTDLDMNKEKWEEEKAKRKEAGRKGGIRSGKNRSKLSSA